MSLKRRRSSTFVAANEKYATDYPPPSAATATNTDSDSSRDLVASIRRARTNAADRQRLGSALASANRRLRHLLGQGLPPRPERRPDDARRHRAVDGRAHQVGPTESLHEREVVSRVAPRADRPVDRRHRQRHRSRAGRRRAAADPGRSTPTRQALIDELVMANHILANEGVLDGYGHVSVRIPPIPLAIFSRVRDSPRDRRRYHRVRLLDSEAVSKRQQPGKSGASFMAKSTRSVDVGDRALPLAPT